MQTLSFTLQPEKISRIHDAIICLAKFSDSVSIEARRDKLILTALNSSKSAYASFCLDSATFFDGYQCNPKQSREDVEARFTCQVYNKALLSVFKSRLFDIREKNTAIERCEVSIQDQPDKAECRLVVKMICRHGVVKTYKLTYESIEVMHALFNKDAAKNKWTISAIVLRSFIEYFGATTEQLGLYSENGRATFTSYTEKVMDGREILKQPLETSIAIDILDFEEFNVEEQIHIGISVKDFKAIVMHAETLKTSITALYSHPTRPMQLAYREKGILCEFTLMTIGDYRSGSVTPAPAVVQNSSTASTSVATSTTSIYRNTPAAQTERQSSHQPSAQGYQQDIGKAMPPPEQPASRSFTKEPSSQKPSRPSPPPPKASLDAESLFLPTEEEEERKWGERTFDEDEDILGWDSNADRGSFSIDFNKPREGGETKSRLKPYPAWPDDSYKPIAPTQRISEVESLFGD